MGDTRREISEIGSKAASYVQVDTTPIMQKNTMASKRHSQRLRH
jgi:hypothetical protein